ncbi:hypothetical protein H6P81_005275 [Aristolochia fimbriata]|uniref:Uncharacterized protein n=1 Tax=Aristolochia fimbriata TaxID=158543 RepID=A0AAV7EXJ7_ARIFI|nr:hypothetical protein H6P81_005275 [Aristolochia fimbriata]
MQRRGNKLNNRNSGYKIFEADIPLLDYTIWVLGPPEPGVPGGLNPGIPGGTNPGVLLGGLNPGGLEPEPYP